MVRGIGAEPEIVAAIMARQRSDGLIASTLQPIAIPP
jgi:hypothetical protein